MQERQIIDNIVLVQEAIHSSMQSKGKGMVIKLDVANDFDRVRHSFLFHVMERFSFNSSFIQWVVACDGNPWISPLVNDRPTGFFQASRGLHQGCPLSPLLFIIVIEALSRKLEKERELLNLPGLQITRSEKYEPLPVRQRHLVNGRCFNHYSNQI